MILASIMLRRLTPIPEVNTCERRARFYQYWHRIKLIITLRQLLETRHIYIPPPHNCDISRHEKCYSVLSIGRASKEISSISCGHCSRMRIYSKLPRSFETISDVRQDCHITPSLFNFVMDDVVEYAFGSLQGIVVELANGEKLCDLGYADDDACLFKSADHKQLALDWPTRATTLFDTHFAPSKYKTSLEDWSTIAPNLMLDEEELMIVDRFSYLGSSVPMDSNTVTEVTKCTSKAPAPYTGLEHLWRRPDISMKLKYHVLCDAVHSVLLCGCGTWSVRVEDIRRLEVFHLW